MDTKKALDTLARAKVAYSKKKTVEVLAAIVMVIKGMGAKTYPLELTGSLRELVQMVGKDPEVVKVLGKAVTFQVGQEQAIMMAFAKVYKALSGDVKEDFSLALTRKKKIDKAFNEGLKLLVAGNLSEADQCFSEAIGYHKDEHSLFLLIGEALMKAEAPKRAFPYLSKGLMADPKNAKMKTLYDQCAILKEKKR